MIEFKGVTKRYADQVAVDHLDLVIKSGEVVMLVGPSGCGKTTTLKMINRPIEPSDGVIEIDGVDTSTVPVTQLRRSIGYVIQQVGLFPHLTVAENVATVMKLNGWDRQRIRKRTEELMELIGMPFEEFGKRLPDELSGGQRQRVGVARALGIDPNMLLMDEPFGAIDPVTRDRLQDELLRLQQIVRKTIIFVTHDIDEAIKLGDRVALYNPDGTIAQYATPAELLAQPASDYVEGFLGAGRLVRRLGLIPLAGVQIPPANGAPPPAVAIDISGTLRDALDGVLRSLDGRVAVVRRPEGEGGAALVGILDAQAIVALGR
ncbi:MAG: ABC transporter ATP-binding protein [Candidatus Dormibacteraeota bacterium]|nr:ABC transporter ATP-binding protein [Candidatus Dormibacteraeota bacterium]